VQLPKERNYEPKFFDPFSVSLLPCVLLFLTICARQATDAVVENRKVERTKAQEETVPGPVYSGNLKLGPVITNVASRFDNSSCRNGNEGTLTTDKKSS
jgi:hypothetical protein